MSAPAHHNGFPSGPPASLRHVHRPEWASAARFAAAERRALLSTPGIGPGVIQRLEGLGIHSFEQIRALGVRATVLKVCDHLGSMAWANRQRALNKALAEAVVDR